MKKKIIKDKIYYCNHFLCRLLGNMFRRNVKPILFDLGKGRYSNSVHTFFLFHRIDIYFLDKDLKIVDLSLSVPPFRIKIPGEWCYYVLETPEGMFKHLKKGDILDFSEIEEV